MSLSKKILAGLAAVAVLALSVYTASLKKQVEKADRVGAQRISESAELVGGLRAQIVRESALLKSLSKENAQFLQRLWEIDKRVVPVVHVGSTASVTSEVPLGGDEHRFRLSDDLKTLFRRQSFHLDVLLVRNLDGKINVGSVSLTELDPDTKAPLDTQFALESEVQVVDSVLDKRISVLHPRLVAGIENHGFPLLGAELLNGERFGGFWSHVNVSLVGIYDTRNKSVLGGALVNWRLFRAANVSVGAGPTYDGRKWGALGAATVQLTR